ncbi:aminotransferase class I/II-fold pyridoxal phosphate-dependent enzyme [Lysinibacillus sp. BF-4]|uniref:aminotransferase class I/II-fold pyridoxal phosphate-dependent enzyme n=1 Tax=Lysinibacillus sp. BF-4 TaxID=1473546 RepID=UPI00068E2CDC|nr:aminotransferase class I/II-fold pyridoxal phosphate-dependent enzyme [Lysinibacillus sp. BF-4]
MKQSVLSLAPSVPLTQQRMPLYEALHTYSQSGVTPFDVPGHKMGATTNTLQQAFGDVLGLDVNSMKELDLLSHPQGVIAEAQSLAAEAFGADEAFFLVNGTTIGILAMIMATCAPGETLLVPRNGHKSVMDGIILSGAHPIFIQPEVDLHFGIAHGVSVASVARAIATNPSAKVLLVTYPTYFGAMSELTEICELAHQHNITVIVDGAHGAHLGFMPNGKDALACGADAVTLSMHKTAGSLTQSSLLLLQTKRITKASVQKVLGMLQTTSASYLLMSSLDIARHELVCHGKERYAQLLPLIKQATKQIEAGGHYEVLKQAYVNERFAQHYDMTKLVVRVNNLGLTGFEVYTLLKEQYNIQMELAEGYVVMAVITPADTTTSLQRLVDALLAIEKDHAKGMTVLSLHVTPDEVNELVVCPREAYYASQETIVIDEAEGRISADTLMIYPPGIPLVIPGEKISRDVIAQYHYYNKTIGNVLMEAGSAHHITVIKEHA